MTKQLVMYLRTSSCPFVSLAKRVLSDYAVPYREVNIDQDETAKARVLHWTGFMSVPTLVVAEVGEDLPCEPPAPLSPGRSPRGIDRGTMITEPSLEDLTQWLLRHGFIDQVIAK